MNCLFFARTPLLPSAYILTFARCSVAASTLVRHRTHVARRCKNIWGLPVHRQDTDRFSNLWSATSTRQVCSSTCSSPNATSPYKVLTALVLEKKRRIPRRQQREVTMTAIESNGGTEQPAAEPEAPAATE